MKNRLNIDFSKRRCMYHPMTMNFSPAGDEEDGVEVAEVEIPVDVVDRHFDRGQHCQDHRDLPILGRSRMMDVFGSAHAGGTESR